jgi:uncharacterized protein involved in exopolysaccharide biosynthesis
MNNVAEVEIDIRRYFDVLLREWRWIVGIVVLVALGAFIWSALQPPLYEATALVVVTKPKYAINFDPRFATVVDNLQAYKVYPELAKSDDVVQSVYTNLISQSKQIHTLDDLNGLLKAESGSDSSLLRLKAQMSDAAEAAHIANMWAQVFIARANEIYGSQDQKQVQSFQTQAENAAKELQIGEQALIDFRAKDRSLIVTNQLTATQQMQVDYLEKQRNITYLLQDIDGLRQQLSKQPASASSGLADRLSALFLQIKAYNVQASMPIQLQFSNPDTLASATVSEQVALLDHLTANMKAQYSEVDIRSKELEPKILALQQQLQQTTSEKERLTQARDVARQTSETLAQKVAETRIAVKSASGEVQLASSAVVPQQRANSPRLANTLVGAALGLFLGVITAFLIDRIRRQQPK